MTPDAAALAIILAQRPAGAHERIQRTASISRISWGWVCIWEGPDGLCCGHQIVTDEQIQEMGRSE